MSSDHLKQAEKWLDKTRRRLINKAKEIIII